MMPEDGKLAFRTAYDLLNRRYPPVNEEEYFHSVLKETVDLGKETNSRLCILLMMAVYDYLAEVAKKK